MENNPKISIITAVYNSESTIAHAIESVCNQTYENIEHLIIDGRSTDKSLTIIRKYENSRIRILSEPDNGLYDALNKGITLSSGDIVGFVHSDDFLPSPTILQEIADAFKNNRADAVYGDLHYVDLNDLSHLRRNWVAGEFNYANLRWGWMPPHPTLYLRKSLYDELGKFNTSYKISADYDFILRLLQRQHLNLIYIPKVLYKMRLGGVSNRSIGNILLKMNEDRIALKNNKIGNSSTLVSKSLRKIMQLKS